MRRASSLWLQKCTKLATVQWSFRCAVGLLLVATTQVFAETWYVGGAEGAGNRDGRNSASGFATIQQAADVVKPGDTVIVSPGVYSEQVQLRTKGTADKPITFRADRIEKSRVVISAADPAIRSKQMRWTLEDEGLGLYSVPWDKPMPSRCLYSGSDLYPYSDVQRLRQFASMDAEQMKARAPTNPAMHQMMRGPQHGYALDAIAKRLYVRLHASGKHGPRDPNQHTMCISPPAPEQVLKSSLQPSEFNFGVLGLGDSHVVIQGITFETPSIVAVYTEANDLIVRDCWFIGCHSGVGGNATYSRSKEYSYDNFANRVTVENCEFTQFPVYDDGCETIRLSLEDAAKAGGDVTKYAAPFWQRKDVAGGLPTPAFTYEIGITRLMGRDWIVRRNHVHDAFEAMSARGTTNTDNLQVYENRFERLLDNAIETEDHATNLYFYRNVIVDTFGPISWQPLKGEPWPGPVFCYQNVMYSTPEHAAIFAFRMPCALKIGATSARKQYGKDYVPRPADPGLLFFNNTIIGDRGCLFWAALWGNNPDQVKLYNNIIVTELNFPVGWVQKAPYLTFENNLAVSSKMPEGLDTQALPSADALRLKSISMWDFRPLTDSPAIGKAVAVPGANLRLQDIGAIQKDDDWFPLQKVGPRVAAQ